MYATTMVCHGNVKLIQPAIFVGTSSLAVDSLAGGDLIAIISTCYVTRHMGLLARLER